MLFLDGWFFLDIGRFFKDLDDVLDFLRNWFWFFLDTVVFLLDIGFVYQSTSDTKVYP
jgi:hypothetical protein